ncbi:MAG: NADH-quinone oxidoreductase subunit N [Verrucomicrobiae bacterium]|nr:NADH-quinone oxidoreductase subunit N [Verrucomicrobiae bacterium]
MSYLELLKLAAPETIVVLTALAVLVVDLTSMRGLESRLRFIVSGLLTTVGCAAALAWMFVMPVQANALEGMLVVNQLTQIVKGCLLGLVVATVLISVEARFTAHPAEFLTLLLFSTVGMMFLVSAEDLLMIFVALELVSLPLYVLAGFNSQSRYSAEAALKYFLFGATAAAFLLFGLSLIYGVTGATELTAIAHALGGHGPEPLLLVALAMLVIGFGFKLAIVPLHLWVPDTYQGAPAPSAAFIASGSKLACFFIFAKIMMIAFAGERIAGSADGRALVGGWVSLLAVVATLSMVLGNLAALAQSSVRRLLGYSAIAHAGYLLLGVLAQDGAALAAVVYYAATYGLATIGAFGVVDLVERQTGDDSMSSWLGFSRRAPIAALAMMVFLFSLAGIPPLAGFFGKFYLFAAVLQTGADHLGLLWLVVLAVIMSVVSFYYYVKVLKWIYLPPPADAPASGDAANVSRLAQIILLLLALAIVALGCFPDLLVGPLQAGL